MPKTHPDEKTLEKFARGKLSRRQNLKVGWHLFNCAACRKNLEGMSSAGGDILEGLFDGLNPLDLTDNPSYQRAFARGQSALEVGGEVRDRDRSRAPKLFTELMRHPVSRQRALIERTWRFKNYVFAEYLLEQSQESWTEDPAKAEDLADLALAVADQLDAGYYGEALIQDLRARAWASAGNARRITFDLKSAEEALDKADSLRAEGTQDPLLKARLLVFRGMVRGEQQRFDEASKLMDEALAIYREAGEDHWVGRTLMAQAKIHYDAGNPEKATELLNQSLGLIDREREPRLELCGQQSLLSYLANNDEFKAAQKELKKVKALAAEVGNDLDRIRVRWLEGHIALGLGHLADAEKALTGARDEFVERSLGYDAALTSLELATLYAKQGRTGEMKELAQEMLPIFRARDIHREATAALIVFQRAAEAEKATLSMVQEISSYLRAARSNPDLRYKRAS